MGINIAIDGPAGAGKSTIAKLVAKRLGYIYVDTGALYRALAVHFLDQGIGRTDTGGICQAVRDAEVSIRYEEGTQQVYLNGNNVTKRLRDEEVGKMASASSAIPQVRERLLALQRDLAAQNAVVMDGRDIGTCILPGAEVKIYLTASVAARAKRRYEELRKKGETCVLEEIERSIEERDHRDMTRETAPLRQAEDAVRIDSSQMTVEEVVEAVIAICRARKITDGTREEV